LYGADAKHLEETWAMRYLNPIFLFLVIVGGINWLLVGVAKFDLVAALTGQTFGETNLISSAIYVLVGVSAIGLVPTLIRWVSRPQEPALA
jgi:uncharacterized membrane protein YuzA (DUF378 family)